MKRIGVLLLIVLVLSILSPLTVELAPVKEGASIVSLDLCNAHGSGLSVNSIAPCICMSSLTEPILGVVSVKEDIEIPVNPFILAYQKEEPPRV